MKLEITGAYSVKFRAFHITFGTIKGKINEHFEVPTGKLNYKQPIDIPGPVDLMVEVADLKFKVTAIFNGFPVYSEEFEVEKFVKGKEFKIKGFDIRGVKLENALVRVLG